MKPALRDSNRALLEANLEHSGASTQMGKVVRATSPTPFCDCWPGLLSDLVLARCDVQNVGRTADFHLAHTLLRGLHVAPEGPGLLGLLDRVLLDLLIDVAIQRHLQNITSRGQRESSTQRSKIFGSAAGQRLVQGGWGLVKEDGVLLHIFAHAQHEDAFMAAMLVRPEDEDTHFLSHPNL